jgi:hypothetical protein
LDELPDTLTLLFDRRFCKVKRTERDERREGAFLFGVVATRPDGARRLRRFRVVASRFGIGSTEKPMPLENCRREAA